MQPVKYLQLTTLIQIKNVLSILNVMMLMEPYHQILLLLVIVRLIHGENHRLQIKDLPILGLYLHCQHLTWIFGMAKV